MYFADLKQSCDDRTIFYVYDADDTQQQTVDVTKTASEFDSAFLATRKVARFEAASKNIVFVALRNLERHYTIKATFHPHNVEMRRDNLTKAELRVVVDNVIDKYIVTSGYVDIRIERQPIKDEN